MRVAKVPVRAHKSVENVRRRAGAPIEPGHRSIASTRVYLHLGDDWLAGEYRRAAEAIEAQAMIGAAR